MCDSWVSYFFILVHLILFLLEYLFLVFIRRTDCARFYIQTVKKLSMLPSIHSLRKLFEINHFCDVRRAFWAPDRALLQKSVCSSQQQQNCHFLVLLVSCTVKDHTSPSVKFTFIQLKKMLQISQKSIPGCSYFRDLCCNKQDIPLQSLV